jgi:hypothetical protein
MYMLSVILVSWRDLAGVSGSMQIVCLVIGIMSVSSTVAVGMFLRSDAEADRKLHAS